MVIKMVLMVFMGSLDILGIQVCFRGVLYFNKVLNVFSTQVLSLLVVAGSDSGLTLWVLKFTLESTSWIFGGCSTGPQVSDWSPGK